MYVSGFTILLNSLYSRDNSLLFSSMASDSLRCARRSSSKLEMPEYMLFLLFIFFLLRNVYVVLSLQSSIFQAVANPVCAREADWVRTIFEFLNNRISKHYIFYTIIALHLIIDSSIFV